MSKSSFQQYSQSFLRFITNIFIVFIIFAVIVDTFPWGDGDFQKYPLQKEIDRFQEGLRRNVLNKLGIEQGIWALFGPEPISVIEGLRAELIYPDGQTREWESLNFTDLTFWEWKDQTRLLNYIQNVQAPYMIRNRVQLPLLAYLAETEKIPNSVDGAELQSPQRIILKRHRRKVLPPFSDKQRAQLEAESPELSQKNSWLLGKRLIKRWKDVETYRIGSWKRPEP